MKLLEIPLIRNVWYWMVRHYPKFCDKLLYRKALGKVLNLNNPKDLNEKIHWLKFHADMDVWAKLADKLAVREFVKERGLGNILVKLYGKYDTPQELFDDWDNLPNKFILKSNNGSGTVKIVQNKYEINKNKLYKEVSRWLCQQNIGLGTVELHYCRITPCLIAEELLEDKSIALFSKSLIDYKIWCFNGNPYCCVAIYGRDFETHTYQFDMYDLDWNPIRKYVSHRENRNYKFVLPKPKNWDKMLEYARILSQGHPEVRMDFYNIDGCIYFGEMTFSAGGGFQKNYSDDFLLKMGEQIELIK